MSNEKILASQARASQTPKQSQQRKQQATPSSSSDLSHVSNHFPKLAESVRDLHTVKELLENFLTTFGDKWVELDEAIAKGKPFGPLVEKVAKRLARTLQATNQNIQRASKVSCPVAMFQCTSVSRSKQLYFIF